jgi:hypothetical protein
MTNTEILISAINTAITTSNSWRTKQTLPFIATILRNADDSLPADMKFDDSHITEAAWRTFEKYKTNCNYTYQEWYNGMYDWLADRILMETRTPLAISLTEKTETITDNTITKASGNSTMLIVGTVLLVLLLKGK